jgi:hypothetical protein
MVMAAAAAAVLCGCVAPTPGYLMELNRNGRWREAECIGQDMLAHRGTFTRDQVAETYFNIIYAKVRMGRKEDAVRLMSEYDAWSAKGQTGPELAWLGREMAKLKDELGLLSAAQRTLLDAMEENGKGNWQRALQLCGEVLAMDEAGGAQKANAHFVAAVCSIRLKDAKSAEAHLAGFDSLKAALPPGSQAIAEERFVRQGLEELKRQGAPPVK